MAADINPYYNTNSNNNSSSNLNPNASTCTNANTNPNMNANVIGKTRDSTNIDNRGNNNIDHTSSGSGKDS